MQIENTTLEERKIVHDVCDIMGERGGRLAAAGLYGILKKIGRTGPAQNGTSSKKKTVIAMDGGLFEHHAPYRTYMESALQDLMGSDAAYEVALRLQNDGSGIGQLCWLLPTLNSQAQVNRHMTTSITSTVLYIILPEIT